MQLPPLLVERPLVAVAVGLTALVVIANPFVLAYWARSEARAKGSSTLDVFIYMQLAVGTVHYWYVRFARGDAGPRDAPPTRRERVAGSYAMAVVTAFVVGATVSPPDPITQALYFLPLFAASFAAAYLVASTASGQRAAATN
ncbi:hypothetical protein ACFQMA_10005 [Halosimplex aquaticum]|uniref:Uncharacterized protein n=1 Tax=Halosimplex aquaticum TaxID=3026162 RepID=A0ABD5Y335_9EURY|nr:hypothetical protein [Halosimplex aquaticum]